MEYKLIGFGKWSGLKVHKAENSKCFRKKQQTWQHVFKKKMVYSCKCKLYTFGLTIFRIEIVILKRKMSVMK